MELAEIREKILTDDAFVLSEVEKIQYLYGLKHEVRYNLERTEDIVTESVADHVYAMHLLANYFLELEDSEALLNKTKVYEMVTWHDIDEVETGDMLGYLKTDEIRAAEADAAQSVIKKSPTVIQSHIAALLAEYNSLETKEAKFVKAIDRIEPLFELYNENGRKVIANNNTTLEQSNSLKETYVQNYPFLKRFWEVVTAKMVEEKHFTH